MARHTGQYIDALGNLRSITWPTTTKEQPTMDTNDGTMEQELPERGVLLLHAHELESHCLELRRQLAVVRGESPREAVGDEMVYLGGLRNRLGV